ncbi:MAG TPA: GntR family transcriptional regulator, partial [Duganella sp.]|uniref:GntR family transcriptional regulator n=1 Tax=Duganella sp. TaxID=1904440 RepID=UPI002ED62B1F
MNDIDKRLPLYHRVRDDMLSKIASGAWPRDAAIPTEVELTQSYGVAIGTVRKAVDTLVADGLLERSQGRGTFIRRPDFQSSLFRFFRHRGGGGRETAPKGRILGRVLGPPPAPVAQALQLPAGDQAIRLDRVRLVDEQPVLLEEIWLPHQRFAALMEMAESDFGDLLYPLYELRCGQTVASAQETLTVEAA